MRVFLAYPPSVNDRLTRAKGRKGFVNTARYRAWKEEAAWVVAMAIRNGESRVGGPYRLDLIVHPPDMRVRDLGNLEKATSDALKDGGAIDDDSLCQKQTLRWGRLPSGPGILCEMSKCPNLLSLVAGKSKSPPEIAKSRRPRRSPRAAIPPAVTTGELSATGRGVLRVPAKRPSFTSAEGTVCGKTKTKPKT
jgi:crossover junction endodeoxyribonuclease RusA